MTDNYQPKTVGDGLASLAAAMIFVGGVWAIVWFIAELSSR